MAERNDDFYIGYKPRTTPGIARRTLVYVAPVFALALVAGSILAWSQERFSDAVFEFGKVKQFEGRLTAEPYPVLHPDGDGPHLLVEFGKHGVGQELGTLYGRRVRANGQLIYRSEGRMIELSDALEAQGSEAPATVPELPHGRLTLIGEIVDSKCYLGVMKPGSGKPHRSCAARCISGGVPPALLVKGSDGSSRLFLLSGGDGEPLGAAILGLVAQPVSVTGEVSERDGLWHIRAALEDIRRWHGEAE